MSKAKIKILSSLTFIVFGLFVYIVLYKYIIQKHHYALDQSIIQTEKYIKNSVNFLIGTKKQFYLKRAKRLFLKDEVLDALENKDRKRFYKLVRPYFNNINAIDNNFWGLHIIFPDNLSFLRVHKPKTIDKIIPKGKKPLIDKVNETKQIITGFSDGKFGYFLRIVFPIFSKENRYLGVAEFSINVDSLTQYIKTTFNYESSFLIKNINNKKFLNKLPKTKDGIVIFKSTSKKIFSYVNNRTFVEPFDIHNEIININDEMFKVVKITLNKTSQLVIAFNITNITSEQEIFKKNIIKLIFLILAAAMVIWYFITKYYLKYFTLQENIKRNLERTVAQKTLELEQNVIKLECATKAKSEFLANMSHEIRTPLNAIHGFINILKENIKDKENKKYLNIVENSSKNLLQIIEDILDFSKIESGKLIVDKIFFNPKDEFETLISLFNAKCSTKGILLNISYDGVLPPSINTDPLRLKQILLNLISNSIKFTHNGKNIWIKAGISDNKLNISVKDEGKGISADKLKHIFEAFNQEESSTTRKYGGTGLGLSISSKLVKLLGGDLKVKSELGIGSEFYFSIPIIIGKEIKKNKEKVIAGDFKGKKILLVEDNKSNQMLMKIVLKKMNLTFDIASDGVIAVDKFKKYNSAGTRTNKYDAILMDENMPNMNGIEATKQILEYEKQNDLIHTPIIALTANALKGDRERFLASGMDEYLTKPIDKIKITKILNEFL